MSFNFPYASPYTGTGSQKSDSEITRILGVDFMRGNLHGGVISSSLDVVGGLVAFVALLDQNPVQSFDGGSEQFSKLGTVDLRIDFLRPGLGDSFVAAGFKLRAGRRIAVARMELHNNSGALIAVGTGTYSIG